MLNARNQKSPVDISRFSRSTVGKRIIAVVEEYEAYMSKKRNTTYVAVRTRQAILRNGPEGAVRNAVEARPSPGFKELLEIGRPELTYEWVALEFPTYFSKRIRERAANRLTLNDVRNFPGYRADPSEKKPAARQARGGGVDRLGGAPSTA